MVLRYYTNAVSSATKGLARTIFIVGLLLIGFAAMILAMPAIFAALVAAIFVIAGVGCIGTAVKIFWKYRKLARDSRSNPDAYRENVQIHIEEHYD